MKRDAKNERLAKKKRSRAEVMAQNQLLSSSPDVRAKAEKTKARKAQLAVLLDSKLHRSRRESVNYALSPGG